MDHVQDPARRSHNDVDAAFQRAQLHANGLPAVHRDGPRVGAMTQGHDLRVHLYCQLPGGNQDEGPHVGR
jgi:hypothetical protein